MYMFGRRKESGKKTSRCKPGERLGSALPCKGKLLSQQGWRQHPRLHREAGDKSLCLHRQRVKKLALNQE